MTDPTTLTQAAKWCDLEYERLLRRREQSGKPVTNRDGLHVWCKVCRSLLRSAFPSRQGHNVTGRPPGWIRAVAVRRFRCSAHRQLRGFERPTAGEVWDPNTVPAAVGPVQRELFDEATNA